jgi:hypothetical protein
MSAFRFFLLLLFVALASASASAKDEGKIEGLEVRGVCDTPEQGCLNHLEQSPLFVAKAPAVWRACQRDGESFICVNLGKEDLERLNSLATLPRRHPNAAFVLQGKILAFMAWPARNPLYFGGRGPMSTAEVIASVRLSPRKANQ